MNRISLYAAAFLSCAVLLYCAGCGGGGPTPPKNYPVAGELFVKGQPAVGAKLRLYPVENADAASWPMGYPRATAGADGKFAFETSDQSGAPAGKYKLLANWMSGEDGQEEDPNAKPRMNQIDPKYDDPATSPWDVEVKPEPNQLPRFEVK